MKIEKEINTSFMSLSVTIQTKDSQTHSLFTEPLFETEIVKQIEIGISTIKDRLRLFEDIYKEQFKSEILEKK